MNRQLTGTFPAALATLVMTAAAGTVDIVRDGQLRAAKITGAPWTTAAVGVEAEGTGRFLHAKQAIGAGDFRVSAKLSLARTDGSAASFCIGDAQFGFDGRDGKLFAEGGFLAGGQWESGSREGLIRASQPFDFEAVRKGGVTSFRINGRSVFQKADSDGPAVKVGFRPWRNRMTISAFTLDGNLIEPPTPPPSLFLGDHAGGTGGYHTYRIPALAVTKKGTVLAFCEGRKHSSADSGDIDLLARRSTDNGKTWSETKVVWDDGANCCGNPCVVVDKETGTIWLLATWNRGDDHEGAIIAQKSKDTRRVYAIRSDDDGLTWYKPVEITADVKKPDWTWYATGPGKGIQIENGPHKGRLVVPCDHNEAGSKRYFSHVFVSDDHGKSWKLGGTTPEANVNECQVLELSGGRLMLNMRNYDRSKPARKTVVSDDGGMTWRDQKHDEALIEPICQAGILRHRWPQEGKPGVILFSNPASTNSRVKMTVRASFDDGATWPTSKLLFDGPSGYSDLATLADGRIACFYEGGENNIAESIIFQILNPSDFQPK